MKPRLAVKEAANRCDMQPAARVLAWLRGRVSRRERRSEQEERRDSVRFGPAKGDAEYLLRKASGGDGARRAWRVCPGLAADKYQVGGVALPPVPPLSPVPFPTFSQRVSTHCPLDTPVYRLSAPTLDVLEASQAVHELYERSMGKCAFLCRCENEVTHVQLSSRRVR